MTTAAATGIKWNAKAIRNGHGLLRAIDHKLRQRMLDLLTEVTETRRFTVTDIYIRLRLEQSVASQHLAILRRAKLIEGKREGKSVYYTLIKDKVAEAQETIDNFDNW